MTTEKDHRLTISNTEIIEKLKYDANGLIPAIVQDANTKEVLMMAWMNRESLRLSLDSGNTWFWSRSRKELWNKGATSGNFQYLHQIFADCDYDTLLVFVSPAGPACHTGENNCFFHLLAEHKFESDCRD